MTEVTTQPQQPSFALGEKDYLSLEPRIVGRDEVKAAGEPCTPNPEVNAEVSSTSITVTARLPNPSDQAQVLFFTNAGYGDSPFEAYLNTSDVIRIAQNQPGSGPSVFEQIFRLEIPPRTKVQWRNSISLDIFDYSGSPQGKVSWVLGYPDHISRRGDITVHLPRRASEGYLP